VGAIGLAACLKLDVPIEADAAESPSAMGDVSRPAPHGPMVAEVTARDAQDDPWRTDAHIVTWAHAREKTAPPLTGMARTLDLQMKDFTDRAWLLRPEDVVSASHFDIEVLDVPVGVRVQVFAFSPPSAVHDRDNPRYRWGFTPLGIAPVRASVDGRWVGVPFVFFGTLDAARDTIVTTCTERRVGPRSSVSLKLSYTGKDEGRAAGCGR
jgi:hypothetical protein